MRAFYALFLLVFLASCGSEVVTDTSLNETLTEQTSQEIDTQLEEIPAEVMMEDTALTGSEITVLDATYANPAGPVNMEVAYSLDSAGTIETIEVTASNWDLSEFNTAVQSVVGMTLEEASDTYVSGSSLTSASFNAALKTEAQ